MACGGRVYKGDTVTISVPFEVDDYTNLTITYSTLGDNVITKTQDEVEIEDGFITYTFGDGELDLLPDGVIYYTIACDVNGVPNVDSTNTNLVLKTPAGYSGRTAEDIYQEGYNDGLEACSGETPDCSSAITQAYQEGYEQGLQDCSGETPDCSEEIAEAYQDGYSSGATDGYQQGYEQGLQDCSGDTPDCSAAWDEGYSSGTTDGYAEGEVVGKAAGYSSGYTDGYNQGQAECSGTPCDCSEEVEEAFQSGYTAGVSQHCNLYSLSYITTSQDTGHITIYPDSAHTGFSYVGVNMDGFGQKMYNSGYTAGQNDCDCTEEVAEAFQSGYTSGYYDGSESCDCSSAITEAYSSGVTAGKAEQKNLLVLTAITENGTYERENGWNKIVVDTPTCNLVEAMIPLTQSFTGRTVINPDAPYNGFSKITIIDGGFGSTMFQNGYSSGYSAGIADCSGDTDCSSAITEAYNSGFTAGEGELHTIEVVIQTQLNYYAPFVPSAVPKTSVVLREGEGVSHVQSPYDFSGITEGDGLDDYIGTYDFICQSQSDPNLYYCSQIYDTTARTLTLCYKGYCYTPSSGNPWPDVPPQYTCPSAIGLDLVDTNFEEWGDWSVKSVRFNGRPLYDNNGSLSKIGNGGFKLVPTFYRDEVSSRTGYRNIFMTMYD